MNVNSFFFLNLTFLFFGCFNNSQNKIEIKTPPNIIFIISDDQSWGDYSFMGHPHIQTPHLDQLAKESITFTKGYVTGFTKKRISAYNYTLDRVGHYKPEHVKNIQEK